MPVDKDGKTEMDMEKTKETNENDLKYDFHPYYGYIPTLVKAKDEEQEEQLYKV